MDMVGAQIEIFDGDDNFGKRIFKCKDCTFPPEKMKFYSGKIFISLKTLSYDFVRGSGFHAQYYTESDQQGRAMGNGKEIWGSPTGLNFRPPRGFNDLKSTVSSYIMTIDISLSQGLYSRIILVFVWLHVGHDDDCSNKQLIIYDGDSNSSPRLHNLCVDSTVSNWIISSGPKLTIEISSRSSMPNNTDFYAQYASETIKGTSSGCGFSLSNPAILESPSFFISAGLPNGESIASNQHCKWIFQPYSKVDEIELLVG